MMKMTIREFLLSADPVADLREMVSEPSMIRLHDFMPEIFELRMEIPAGAHHKDNLLHSIKVLENAIAREKNGADVVLRTAALYHDVGKPATRVFQGRKTVTFDNHEAVGASMMRKILRGQGYSKSEMQEIGMLVRYHMRGHGFSTEKWTDSGIRRMVTDVPNEQTMGRLIIIFYSDVTSKNRQTRNEVHANIANFEKALAEFRVREARSALRPAINGNEVMEMTGLAAGRELGMIMKFLNSDAGIALSREEAEAYVRSQV